MKKPPLRWLPVVCKCGETFHVREDLAPLVEKCAQCDPEHLIADLNDVTPELEAELRAEGARRAHFHASTPSYEDFLAAKALVAPATGLAHDVEVHPRAFPHQRDIVRWALRRGRAAVFADTGLGKTGVEVLWAQHVARHTGRPVLILAPLAVSQQTVREGTAFDVPVAYAREQSEVAGDVVITNYERIEAFDAAAFGGVVLDESSVLKNYSGKTKNLLCERFASTPFKLAATATPAPNDHLELGNHSEFLGVLTSHEMIARWFISDQSTFGTYRLKKHAVAPFWDWVSSWACCVGRPSDMGHSDEGYVLPELRTVRHVVDADIVEGRGDMLFRIPDMSATSLHREKRLTAEARARKVAVLVYADPGQQWLIWCDTDYEADALRAVLPAAVEVRGSDALEKKEERLLGFADGEVRVLLTKPRIAGMGMNFQRCARMAFIGVSHSYEAFYQSVRRCWRFGQRQAVEAHVVMAQTETGVWDVLLRKAAEHDSMKAEMFKAMRRHQAKEDNRRAPYIANASAKLPAWLATDERRSA